MGLVAVEVPPAASPNVQRRDEIGPSASVLPSVNVQESPVQATVNAAAGGVLGAVTVTLRVTLLAAPAESVTVSVTP